MLSLYEPRSRMRFDFPFILFYIHIKMLEAIMIYWRLYLDLLNKKQHAEIDVLLSHKKKHTCEILDVRESVDQWLK